MIWKHLFQKQCQYIVFIYLFLFLFIFISIFRSGIGKFETRSSIRKRKFIKLIWYKLYAKNFKTCCLTKPNTFVCSWAQWCARYDLETQWRKYNIIFLKETSQFGKYGFAFEVVCSSKKSFDASCLFIYVFLVLFIMVVMFRSVIGKLDSKLHQETQAYCIGMEQVLYTKNFKTLLPDKTQNFCLGAMVRSAWSGNTTNTCTDFK